MRADDFLDDVQPPKLSADGFLDSTKTLSADNFLDSTAGPRTNSLLSGVISRIYGITGDLVEGAARIGEQGGDYLESKFPLSGLTGQRLTPQELQQRQLEPVFKAAEWLKRKQADINYQPSVDFDQIKQDPLNLPQTGRFVLEQGVTSLPDMAASVLALPAYTLSMTNNIASERAANENRPDVVTMGDMAKAAPAAALSSLFERYATQKLLPGGVGGASVPARIGSQVGVQAGTEAVQEVGQYAGESLGTQKGMQSEQALDRAMAGALVGGALGGAIQTGAEGFDAVNNTPERQLARAINDDAQTIADSQTSPQDVRRMFSAPISADDFLDSESTTVRVESNLQATPQAASALTVPPVTAPESPRPVLPQPELPAAPELTPAAQTEPPTQPVAEVPPFEAPVDQAEQAAQIANELPSPLALTRGQQITEARPGMRPGDIVSREGKVFTNQAVAKAAATEAGNSWRVKRANGGFVVRYQPPTAKQIETAKANARRAANIDPTRDSMFAAIAKLGGVNKTQLVSEWGVDPADLKNTFGAGIKRVATSKGRTLDDIAESLSELGYLSKDANGKWDLREFEELFGEELSGSKHFTAEGFESQAQAQQEQAYEDFLTEQDAQESGYNDLPEEAQDLIDEVLNDYEQISAEEEARLEREAIQWADGQPITSLEEQDADIPFDTSPEAQSDRDPFETDSQASTESDQGERTNDVATELELSGQTPQELRAQQEAQALQAGQRREEERRAQADDMAGDFRLTGSDREVDQAEAAGQTNLLDQLDDENAGRIDDFGEKIGGARKDTAQPTGTRQRTQEQDDTPTWRKRFAVVQNTTSGKHVIFDKRTNKPMREGWRVLEFDTEEAANNMVPLAAVAQKHRVVVDQPGDNPTYKIIRDVTDRKRVTIRDGFPNREEAMQYMAENAVQILETKTGFGEEILSKPETVTRRGAERHQGDVKPKDFSERFGFRGVEFGNWNNQEERQEVMNHAFDGLLDLAELLNVPPKALSLNGDLALAFGARGQGLSGARAHYERNYGVINLTKMSGAGSLAHEWWHALDHYLGRQDGKAPSERVTNERGDKVFGTKGRENDYVSYGFGRQSKVRAELAQAYDALMNTMFTKAEQYVEDTQKAEKFLKATRDALDESLGKLRRNLQAQLDPKYYKRNNKPASEEQLAAFDVLADKLLNGQDLETDFRPSENKNASRFTGRWSNDTLDAMSAIYKSVRGRAGFTSERSGTLDAIANDMRRYKQRIDMLESARAADTKTRRVPTSYAMEAKRIDQGRSSDYWTTPHEMAARAFSSYVEDKLASQQARSDFLSYGSNNNLPEYRLFGVRPFPEGDERATINEAFDRFVSEIRTRETDQGVELYRDRSGVNEEAVRMYSPSESRSKTGQMTLDAVNKAKDAAIKGIPDAPLIEVFSDPAAAGLSVPLGQRPMGATLPDGRIVLFADNLSSIIDVHETIFHELFHRGAKVRFNRNQDYVAAMLELASNDSEVSSLAQEWKVSPDGESKRELFEQRGELTGDRLANYEALAVEEALAIVAERIDSGLKPNRSTIQKIATALAKIADAFGMDRLANWIRRASENQTERFVIDTIRMSGGTPNKGTTAILFKSGGLQDLNQPWNIPEPTAGDAFVRAIQNNKIDLKRVRDAIAQQYGTIPDDVDAYLGEELYQGKVSARVESLYKDSVEPILAKIAVADKNNGVTLDDVNQYLHARHAPERNAAMKAINPNMQDNEALSGMSDAQARKIMADFKANGKDKALAAIAKDIDQLISDTRTNLVADGLEDAGAVRAWESAYKHYVPLQRDVKGGTPRGMGFSVRGPEAKRAVGSNRQVVNILANIVAQAETAAIRAEKATVGRALLAMARQYPNENFWTVDTPPTKPRIDKDTGLVIRGAVDPLYQTADNVVMVKDYGKEHFIVFNKNNERAMETAKAMRNLGIEKTGRFLQWANRATRFLASLLTQRNPVFWLTNFSRDIQGALINLEGTKAEGLQKQVLKNLPKAFKGMRSVVRGDGRGQWARYAREFQDAGGATGYMQVFENSDERMKDIRKEVARMQQGKADPRRLGRQILQFIDDYNDVIENAVRLSVFQTAREGGASIKQAASIAKNITVNFNRKGNLTPNINSLYMFFNASVQGTARLAQAIVTSRTAQVAVGGIAMAGFLLDLVNRAMSDDDEDTGRNRYDMIPEYEKAKNWIVMNPMRPGEYVKIPLPLGPHVFHNVGRLLSDAIFREDPRNAQEYGWAIASTLMDAFSPLGATTSMGQLIAPSVADPVLQLSENQSFMGTSVYKSADRGFGNTDPAPAYTRYFESTPDVWKAASKALNDMSGGDDVKPGSIDVEPDILKHVFYTMTGGPGRTIDQLIDSTQAEARGQETNVNRLPLASRFYGANDDRQRERIYYDDRKRILDAKTQFDYFNKQGRRDLAREVAEELGDGDYTKGLRKMREFSSTQSVIRKINTQIRQELEKQAGGEDRTEQLKALKKRRTEFMSGAVRDDE